MGKSADCEAVVNRLRDSALDDPGSDTKLFAWGYAAIGAARLEGANGRPFWSGYNRLRERGVLAWLIAQRPAPKDFRYCRVRFLVESMLGADPHLLDLGSRLAAKMPEDMQVERAIIAQYDKQSTRESSDMALKRSNDLVGRNPLLPNLLQREHVLVTRWLRLGHSPSDRRAAIDAAEMFLAKAPGGCPDATGVEGDLAMLRSKRID